jgi:alkanesulfonate monooxygenase SsuD/methylene tetrahydromethanopterin reductase-like flavin-dependent oxidoreductase (luciferase family)
MRVGLMLVNQHPPADSIVDRWGEVLGQVRLARSLGFDLIVFGQHYLVGEFAMLQPAVSVARAAAEAGTMRIGVSIYLLPLLNPVAVAEETATLDVITGGRFIFGVGLGYREVEDRAFGVGKGERVRRLRDHLRVIRQLWAGEPASLDAPYCRLDGVRIGLRPVQRPGPPVWMAANNDRAVERAARLADTWVINPHATLATITRQMDIYRAALAAAGKPFPAELPMRRELFVAETSARAIALARPYVEKKYEAYVAWGQHRALPADDDMTQAFEGLAQDRFILGDPARCADEINRCAALTGATTMIFRVNFPGMPNEVVTGAMRLLAEQVRPRLASKAL